MDSFSSFRPVPKEVDKQDGQDEEPDEGPNDQGENEEEEHESDEGDGAPVDAKDQAEVDANIDESDQSDSVEPCTAPSVKVKARLGKREKQSIVNAGDARRTAETKKLARTSDVRLVIMAKKEGLGKMVKLDAESAKVWCPHWSTLSCASWSRPTYFVKLKSWWTILSNRALPTLKRFNLLKRLRTLSD